MKIMKTCCVEGCNVSSEKEVSLFDFPTSRLLRKRWLDAIGPGARADGALVCSRHFAPGQYSLVRGRVRLESKVVPSVFGRQAQAAHKDPLDLPETHIADPNQIPQTTQSDTFQKGPPDNDSHNGKDDNVIKSDDNKAYRVTNNKDLSDNGHKPDVDKDNEKVDDHNGKGHNNTVKVDKSNGTVHTDNGKVDNDNSKVDNDNGKVDNDSGKVNNDNSIVDNDNLKVDNESRKVDNVNSKVDNDNGKVDNDNLKADDKLKVENDNLKVDNDNLKVDNLNEKVDSDSRKVDNDNGKVDNNIGKDVKDSENADKPRAKRVKKKWVPLRKIPSRSSKRMKNGDMDLSEDSSDSVNSDVPQPPLLEDLEEQLPNYQIENKKTERQVAAMAEAPASPAPSAPPPPPHASPVFIELSVGQEKGGPGGQANDCLMVLESVQCEVDPALMLAAREEDDECLEQIDLDDDDDKSAEESSKSRKKPPTDPISLLTSSDEDDVILQEPHIDCLSVSDETDEDDVPLTRLIKAKPKQKKKKKAPKKKLNAQDIINGVDDYFCMHCQYVSTTMADHRKHVRTHLSTNRPDPLPTTKVYQICKECGFTTSSKSQLYRHQKKHTSEKRYKCPLCSYRSKYNMSLMYHLKTHEFDPNLYNCGACGLELEDKRALLEHQECCYALEEEFKCGVCGYSARSKQDLKTHRRQLHKSK